MLRNYIVAAFRSTLKNKLLSTLNIFGLAIGMAGALLILQYVTFEKSYNKFHEQRDNIYRISYSKEKSGVESFNTVLTYTGVGPLMVAQFPEVVDFVRLRPASAITSRALIRYEHNFFEEEDVYYTDPSFFEIFSFEMVEGDAHAALKDPFTAVITESMAKKYFGRNDPIGKTIRKGQDQNYVITGIMKDTPANSHVRINLLLSHSTLPSIMGESWTEDNLTSFHGHLYIRTTPGSDPDMLRAKFPQFAMDFIGGEELAKQDVVLKFGMLPLTDIHLQSHIEHEAEINGDQDIVFYLSIVGLLILLIATVNYVNMATARAMERAREIGVRKVIGATKSGLVLQYVTESFVVNLFAIALGLAMFFAVQPFLADLGASKVQNAEIVYQPWFWLAVAGTWVTSSLLSGFYPALVLSSYKPVIVLKGRLTTNRSGISLRKGLVVFQFASSVALIIGTIIIYSQITFMQEQKLGMNIDDKLVLKGPMVIDTTYISNYAAWKNALLQLPIVKGVSASQSIPGKEYNSATWFTRVDNPETDSKFCYINSIEKDFATNYEMEFLAGRDFTETDQMAILVNEAVIKLFDFESLEDAIGKSITAGDPANPESRKWKITGIVKDFNQQSLKNDFDPVIMFRNDNIFNFYSVQLTSAGGGLSALTTTIGQIQDHWSDYFPGNPFNYHFLRAGFDAQYKTEVEFGRLLYIFSGLTIFVAILGLIGLSSYTIQQRTKELGIRKVLGSSVSGIAVLLSKDIFGPIFIANLIAWPVCWYVFSDWLAGFAFRTEMSVWPFLLAFVLISAVAASAIAYQVARASVANPVKALKYE